VIYSVVRQGRVRNTVGATEQTLEGDVGHKLPHLAQTVPGVLVQEAHGDIEGSTAPALKSPGVAESVAGLLSDVAEVDGADSGGEEGLVGVAPGGIHDHTSFVCSYGLDEGLWSLLVDDVSPACGARHGSVDESAAGILELGHDDVALELGLANLALDLAAVDSEISKVGKELLRTVLAADQLEQLRSVVDESGPAVALDEGRVGEQGSKEGNVGLDTTDTELDKSAKHLSASDLIGRTQTCALHQHAVVVRSDDSTGETIATIETDTIATSRAVYLDLASVRLEALRWVLSGDTALNGETTGGNAVLGQTQLLE
jgi:hypothetical protein